MLREKKISLLGGTGDLGTGLASRLIKAGYKVIIGSRMLKKAKNAYCLPKITTKYRIRSNSLQSNKFRNLFWIWNINKKYNNFSFFKNLISLYHISISSIMKYGVLR